MLTNPQNIMADLDLDDNCKRCGKLEIENGKLRALNMRLQNQLLAKLEGKKFGGGFFFTRVD